MARAKLRGEPETVRILIGGHWRKGRDTTEVIDPYRGAAVARAPRSTREDVDDALRAAVAAKEQAAALPGYQRAELLRRVGRHVFRGVKSTNNRMKEVNDSCRNIAGLWPTITPNE